MTAWDHVRAALIVLHIVVLTIASVPEYGHRVVRPFRPYIRATGLRQSWQMFGTVQDEGGVLQIHGRTPEGWVPLYVDDTPHQWRGRLLNHGRVRAQRNLFAHARFRPRYREMVAWLAAEALGEHPQLTAVRVRFLGVRTPPIDVFEGQRVETGVFWEETVERAP